MKNTFQENENGYCRFCQHCNNLKDDNLEFYLNCSIEAKNIIQRSAKYIINKKELTNKSMEIFNNELDEDGAVSNSDIFI